MPNQLQNLLSALQQVRSGLQGASNNMVRGAGQGLQNAVGGAKALISPDTRNDYLVGAKQTLKSILENPKIKSRPASNVPQAFQKTFNKATEGFTPAAMGRARGIRINYTPIESDAQVVPFGERNILGVIPVGSAGVYEASKQGGRGAITIGMKYAQDPDVLRHELIHAMDTNTNFVNKSKLPWKDANGIPYTEDQRATSAAANESFTDALPLLQKYLSGLGIVDSRGFYPSVDGGAQNYINARTSGPLYRYTNEPVDPQMLDLEGMAYMGTTGDEYSLPQYQSAIQEAIRSAQAPQNSSWGKSLLNAGVGKLKPQNHIPGMD